MELVIHHAELSPYVFMTHMITRVILCDNQGWHCNCHFTDEMRSRELTRFTEDHTVKQ